jgi:hypothetical protein
MLATVEPLVAPAREHDRAYSSSKTVMEELKIALRIFQPLFGHDWIDSRSEESGATLHRASPSSRAVRRCQGRQVQLFDRLMFPF